MMNRFERVIAAVAPSWGAARAQDRYLIAQYEGAQSSNGVPAKRAKDDISKDIEAGQLELSQVARHYEQNDPTFCAAIDEIVKNTIGDGLKIHPQPKNMDGTVNKEFAKQIRRLIKEHDKRFEMDGRTSRAECEQLIMRCAFRDGEAFANMVYLGGHDYLANVPFGVQLFPMECIDPKLNDEKKGIINGVQYGKWNRVIAYMFKANPTSNAKAVALSAENVLHIKFVKQIRQGRGISVAAPAIKTMKDLDAFFEAYRMQTITAARIALVHKRKSSTNNNGYDKKGAKGKDFKLGVLNTMTIGHDDKLELIESKKNIDGAAVFNATLTRKITSALGASHSSVTSEYIKSFTAQRQEQLDRWAGYLVLRKKVAEGFTRPCYEKIIGVAILAGILKVPSTIDHATLYDCDITGAVMPWIDPLKETNALRLLNKMGMKALTKAIAERGGDIESELNAYKEEMELMNELGLEFDDNGEMKLIDELLKDNPDDEENSTSDAGGNG